MKILHIITLLLSFNICFSQNCSSLPDTLRFHFLTERGAWANDEYGYVIDQALHGHKSSYRYKTIIKGGFIMYVFECWGDNRANFFDIIRIYYFNAQPIDREGNKISFL